MGSMHRSAGELAKCLEHRRVDVLCIHEKRWRGGGSARMVVGRKMFWKGSEDGLLVFEKW